MILEQFNLVCLIKLHAFAKLSGFSLLHQSRFISLNLRPNRIIFDSCVKSLLAFCHFISFPGEHLCAFGDFLGLFGLPILYFRLVNSDLFLNLPFALLLLPGFLLYLPLPLLVFHSFELRCLISYLISMLFLLHFLQHVCLLLAEFLFPSDLLDNLHLALVLRSLLLKI